MGSSNTSMKNVSIYEIIVLIAAIMTYFLDKANDAGQSSTLPASKIIIEVNTNSIVHFR